MQHPPAASAFRCTIGVAARWGAFLCGIADTYRAQLCLTTQQVAQTGNVPSGAVAPQPHRAGWSQGTQTSALVALATMPRVPGGHSWQSALGERKSVWREIRKGLNGNEGGLDGEDIGNNRGGRGAHRVDGNWRPFGSRDALRNVPAGHGVQSVADVSPA